MDQDVAHLWQLVNELSEQLTANRTMTEALKNQASNVKGQAVHSGVGFPLRRFNIDISDEQFTSELERFASHLVLENQNLAYENKQLNLLLKEYEQTLEGVMGKFRGVCHAATQHELTLHQYYTSLLQQLQTTHSTSSLHDSTTLSTLLQRLSTLIRAALRSINGEDEEFEHPGFDMPSPIGDKPSNMADVIADIQNMTTSSTTSGPRTAGTRRSHAKWLGDQGVSGGYSGKSMARLDWSIEREGEIIRLEEENRLLREMLGVAKDVDPASLLQQPESNDSDASEVESSQPEKLDQSRAKATESTKENNKESEKPEGYVVENGPKEEAEEPSINKTPSSPEETEAKTVHHDLDDSAIAEEDESPSSPLMTATAALTRSLSTSPNSRFKASQNLSKYATYSGGLPKSPTINRSHSSAANMTQSVSSPNASLANIFPRQAKTEPTTATTTTVEIEGKTVDDEAPRPKTTSVPSGQNAPSTMDMNGISKSRIEIKKVNTPPLPGSPLGKTPPKTGITFDHAVESRGAAAKKKEVKIDKPEHGNGESEKQSPKKEESKTGSEADAKSQSSDTEQPEENDEKPSYADVAKEDPTG